MSKNEALHNQEMEQSLLGILLVEPAKLDDLEWFDAAWFYLDAHARIYGVILEAYRKGSSVGASYLAQYFAHDKDLEHVGGSQYIYELAEGVVTVTAAKDLAEHIHLLHSRRALLALSERIRVAVTDVNPEMTPERIFAGVEKFLYESKSVKRQDEAVSSALSADSAINALLAPVQGISTGLKDLDAKIGGLMPGALYIVAGRPAMGKTAFGLTLSVNIAASMHNVLFFSLEMTHTELMKRVLSRFVGRAVHSGERANTEELSNAKARASRLLLSIDDSPALTASDIRARAKRYNRKHGLSVVVVDYLGMMQAEDRRANKVHQIEEITQGLKRLAKELGVPVVLLCQLSRGIESREDKRPTLSDLRDSGAIEQDADVVMFLYRAEYYANKPKAVGGKAKWIGHSVSVNDAHELVDQAALKGVAEVIIAKQRQGADGTLELQFSGERQVFEDRKVGAW